MAAQTLTRTKLELLVQGFDRDVSAGTIKIRELMAKDPRSFQDGIVPVIKSSLSTRGAQFMVSLLVTSDYLMPVLCDPALKMEEALALARMALPMDPMMDVTMARKLADDTVLGWQPANAGRLLDVLGKIATGNRITSSLLRMLRTTDPQLRSKVVLLIGRNSRSVKWVQTRLAETDPRTRANAVESLWDVDGAEAKELLRGTARDGNNRVAGNAIYALYRMGDTWVFPELFKMAASDSPMFRSSAAWVMGETDDPRFSETLGRMVGETNAIVRKRAFSALARLKTAAKKRQGVEWRVSARLLSASGTQRQIRVEAGPTNGSALPQLLATQFHLTEDLQPVYQFQVEACPPPEALAVTFLFPRVADSSITAWVQGAVNSLQWKRVADLYSAMFYLSTDESGQGSPDPPQFTSDREAAVALLEKPPDRKNCASFWDGLRVLVQSTGAIPRGIRHVIAYNLSSAEPPADVAEIIAAAILSTTTVHVLSPTPNAALEELCRRTRGRFQLAQGQDQLSRLVEEAALSLSPRFALTYSPKPGARELTIRVHNSEGWGETNVVL